MNPVRVWLSVGLLLGLVSCRKSKVSAEEPAQRAPTPSGAAAAASASLPSSSAPAACASLAASSEPKKPPAPAAARIVPSELTLEPMLTSDEHGCGYELHSLRGAVIVTQCQKWMQELRDGRLEPVSIPETGFGVDHATQAQGNSNG